MNPSLGAMSHSQYRTWKRTRASPLRLDYYPAGHPTHVTIRTDGRRQIFANSEIARIVFRLLRSHERTLAAVLMPDHLHWLLDCAEKTPRAVSDFKSLSTHLFWENGFQGKLWQRSYWDHVIRDAEGLATAVRYLLANPHRAELAENVDEYPWCYDRFGLAEAPD